MRMLGVLEDALVCCFAYLYNAHVVHVVLRDRSRGASRSCLCSTTKIAVTLFRPAEMQLRVAVGTCQRNLSHTGRHRCVYILTFSWRPISRCCGISLQARGCRLPSWCSVQSLQLPAAITATRFLFQYCRSLLQAMHCRCVTAAGPTNAIGTRSGTFEIFIMTDVALLLA